jgi:hypothetical protein
LSFRAGEWSAHIQDTAVGRAPWAGPRARKLLPPLVILAGVLVAVAGLVPPAALAAGTASAASAGPPLKWSAPVLAERPPYVTPLGVEAMSCTPSECVALDNLGGVLTSADPARGGASWRVTRAAVPPLNGAVNDGPALSCAAGSRVLCAGVDNGQILVSTDPAGGPSAWRQVKVPITLDSMACPSASFCVAGGAGGFEWSADPAGGPAAWHSVKVGTGVYHVSCPSRSFCAAIDVTGGDVLTSARPAGGPKAWKITDLNGPATLNAIACPAASLCVATDSIGDVITSARPAGGISAWKRARLTSEINSITCPSKSECIGFSLGLEGAQLVTSTSPAGGSSAWQFAGITWIGPQAQFNDIPLACASSQLCVAGNGTGDIVTSASPVGGAATWRPADVDGANTISAVDCPAATLCVAGDTSGNVLTSTDPAAGHWKLVSLEGRQQPGRLETGIRSVTCPSVSLCLALDTQGRVFASARPAAGRSAWHLDAGPGITQLACPTARVCAGIAATSLMSTTDPAGGIWHTITPLHTFTFTALSCPNPSLCVTTENAGQAWTTTSPGKLSAWRRSGGGGDSTLVGLSCAGRTPAAAVCAVTDADGLLTMAVDPASGPQAWQTVSLPATKDLGVPYCPRVSLCLAFGTVGPEGSQQSATWYSTDPARGVFSWKDKLTSPVPVSGSTFFGGAPGPGFTCPGRTLCIGPWSSPAPTGVITTANPIAGGKTWTVTPVSPQLPGAVMTALGCASTSLCVAGDSGGDLYTGTPSR